MPQYHIKFNITSQELFCSENKTSSLLDAKLY